MRKLFLLLMMFATSNVVFGQSNYEAFKKLFKQNDTTKIKTLLANWEKSNADDPELYTSAFNYYFSNSKQEIISINKTQLSKESFQITDSTGAIAGYFSSTLDFNPGKLSKAFTYANKGIKKFPNRLDLLFGKCYVLGEIGDYDNFTAEIIKIVKYSVVNKNNWQWTENKKLDDAQNSMLGSIQSYLKQLYDTENDSLLINIMQLGDTTLKYYPDCIEILSTTAVANMLTENYDKAIQYLKHAEQLNPKDFIVLNNIAHAYKLKGDKANAVKYYELAAKYGDEKTKQLAAKEIKEINQ